MLHFRVSVAGDSGSGVTARVGAPGYTGSGLSLTDELGDRLSHFVSSAYAPSTTQRYQFRCNVFAAFCKDLGESPLPADTKVIGKFLTHLFINGRKPGTVRSYLAAIAWSHKVRDLGDPSKSFLLRQALDGMSKASPPVRRVAPLTGIDFVHACQSSHGS